MASVLTTVSSCGGLLRETKEVIFCGGTSKESGTVFTLTIRIPITYTVNFVVNGWLHMVWSLASVCKAHALSSIPWGFPCLSVKI